MSAKDARLRWDYPGLHGVATVPGKQSIDRLYVSGRDAFAVTRYGTYRVDMTTGVVVRRWCGLIDWLRYLALRVSDGWPR